MADFEQGRHGCYGSRGEPLALRATDSRGRLSPHKAGLLLSEDQWEAVLVVADHNHFGIRTLGEIFRGFDSLPFQERWSDALGDDLLKVADAGGLDALTLRFLCFFLQAEVHGQRFLLGLLLGFDGRFQRRGELDVPQENVLYG